MTSKTKEKTKTKTLGKKNMDLFRNNFRFLNEDTTKEKKRNTQTLYQA